MAVKSPQWVILAIIAVLFVAAALLVSLTNREADPPAVAWPSGRIARITVKLRNQPEGSEFAADFEVDPSRFGKIMEALSPAIPFDSAPDLIPIGPEFEGGDLRIQYAEGPTIEVLFYLEGQNPLVFKKDGRMFLRGGRYNPELQEDHRRIYGHDVGSALDESHVLVDLLRKAKGDDQAPRRR